MARWWIVAVLALLGWTQAGSAQGPDGAFAAPAPPAPGTPPAAGAPAAGAPAVGAFMPPGPDDGPKGSEFCAPGSSVTEPNSLLVPFQPREEGNAFSDDDHESCHFYFFTLGAMALSRQGLGTGTIAVRDPNNQDTGIVPFGALQEVGFNNVNPSYNWGPRASFGWGSGGHVVEFLGYYLFRSTSNQDFSDRGRLDLPFANFAPPFGFLGNNFLWLQADRVTTTLSDQIGNAEANYRCTCCDGCDFILGIRYFDLQERFRIRTDDEGLSGPLDPRRIADYSVNAHSRLLGPQIGFEVSNFVLPNVAISVFSKGMVAANFLEAEQSLTRGDFFQGPFGSRRETTVSYLAEIGGFLNLYLMERVHFRLGYQGLWVGHVPEAHAQINFDPNIGGGSADNRGLIFFHGPIVEARITW